jgi:adenylosuccinate lyase
MHTDVEQERFDSISPLDYRYRNKKARKLLSENGFTLYKLLVELALIKAFARRGLCPAEQVEAVERACKQVTTAEVYREEKRIKHDIRALVNCLRAKLERKEDVHKGATSYDIVDTANAARYRDAIEQILIPSLIALERVLIDISLREADTIQIGRTHGQHAVPITFGFAMSGFVSRLGESIVKLKGLASELNGKFSGAVGAYNATSLIVDDPKAFEAEILEHLGLQPAEHSTQIVPPDRLTRLFAEVTITGGILGNLAHNMRHLQRTEIGEVYEESTEDQVGSSTMPHKRNPINLENAASTLKILIGRMVTVFLNQVSEHERDLTSSASSRPDGEHIAYLIEMADRMTATMGRLRINRANIERNLHMQGDLAEPLYILLAAYGHPDAHEKVRKLTRQAEQEQCSLSLLASEDQELKPYLLQMKPEQLEVVQNPSLYIGLAPVIARTVAEHWKQELCSED